MQQFILFIQCKAALHQEYYVLLITERISWASATNSATVHLYDYSDDFVSVWYFVASVTAMLNGLSEPSILLRFKMQ